MDIHAQIAELTDKKLLDWLEKGKEYISDNGVKGRRDLSAAEVTVILKRLQQLGVGSVAGTNSTSDALVEAAKKNILGAGHFTGRLVPQVDLDGDDMATGT